MDVLVGFCTFQLRFFLTLVNTSVMLDGVAACEAQTRVLCIPEMNFSCQICAHFWLHHLMAAFCFGVQHMCCYLYVNFFIYIYLGEKCVRRERKKDFRHQALGECVPTFHLLSGTRLVSLRYLEKAMAAVFLGHSDFHSWYFQLLLGRLEAELDDAIVKAKLCQNPTQWIPIFLFIDDQNCSNIFFLIEIVDVYSSGEVIDSLYWQDNVCRQGHSPSLC